jgi:hypothetical protein
MTTHARSAPRTRTTACVERQMAQTLQKLNGSPDGCNPAASVTSTKLLHTSVGKDLASVTVSFGVAIDGRGTMRDGFVRIRCVHGGPTSDFRYSTIGDDRTQSRYEINTLADCTKSGIDPVPKTFACLDSACVEVDPPGSGVPKDVCDRICINPDSKYVTVHQRRVRAVVGSDPRRGQGDVRGTLRSSQPQVIVCVFVCCLGSKWCTVAPVCHINNHALSFDALVVPTSTLLCVRVSFRALAHRVHTTSHLCARVPSRTPSCTLKYISIYVLSS